MSGLTDIHVALICERGCYTAHNGLPEVKSYVHEQCVSKTLIDIIL